MYELIATAAAGLQAGVGMHAAIAGAPSDNLVDAGYHSRTRFLNIILAMTSCGCGAAAYYEGKKSVWCRAHVISLYNPALPTTSLCPLELMTEGHGNLWLVAATGAALAIPYHILLMTPPTPYFGASTSTTVGTPALEPPPVYPPSGKTVSFSDDSRVIQADQDRSGEGFEKGIGHRQGTKGRLMYARSGVLITPEAATSSWSRKYWFGAALSCATFGAMVAILSSKRDAAVTFDR